MREERTPMSATRRKLLGGSIAITAVAAVGAPVLAEPGADAELIAIEREFNALAPVEEARGKAIGIALERAQEIWRPLWEVARMNGDMSDDTGVRSASVHRPAASPASRPPRTAPPTRRESPISP